MQVTAPGMSGSVIGVVWTGMFAPFFYLNFPRRGQSSISLSLKGLRRGIKWRGDKMACSARPTPRLLPNSARSSEMNFGIPILMFEFQLFLYPNYTSTGRLNQPGSLASHPGLDAEAGSHTSLSHGSNSRGIASCRARSIPTSAREGHNTLRSLATALLSRGWIEEGTRTPCCIRDRVSS